VSLKYPLLEQDLHHLFHEERRALRALDNLTLNRAQILVVAKQHREHFSGTVSAERVESELGVMGTAAPIVAILGPVVHQQQNTSTRYGIDQQIEHGLGLAVDPVQVLEDNYQRLIQALTQQDTFDRLLRAPPPDLRIHPRQPIAGLSDAEQRIE